VLTATEKELGVMLLDIGGGTCSITSFVEDAITYSGSVPFGGANVTSDLAIGLRVSLEEAEKIKLNAEELMKGTKNEAISDATKKRRSVLGQEGPKKPLKSKSKAKDVIDVSSLEIDGVNTVSKKLFNEIMEARLSEIFDIVIRQVEQSGNETRLPAGVVLTGGSALIPGITTIAKKVFGIPSRVGFPKGLQGLVDEISNPAYSVVQGLALYGSMDEGYAQTRGQQTRQQGSGGNIASKLSNMIKNLLP